MRTEPLLAQEKSAYAKVEAPCPYFGTCGGCAIQDVAYADQLRLKAARIRRALAFISGLPPVEVIGLEDPWRYRNRAEFTFGALDGALALGYHAARSFWRVVDLEDCLLLPEEAMRVVRSVRALAASTGLPPYHPRSHQGFFRYLLIRHSRATGRILVCLITATGARAVVDAMAEEIVARHPAVSSVWWGLTNKPADVAVPEELTLMRGAEYLEDELGPFRLKLHPFSFLQPSSAQAQRLYAALSAMIGDLSEGIVWDLYCGIGLVSFYLARQARTVYGIDVEPRHLELAAMNASLNGLRNIEFRAGKVETLLMDRRFWLQEAKPDAIVVDPPRAGLHAHALSSLLAARPGRIAYVSCNVQSLARDLGVLCSSFPRYRLAAIQSFDMFPQTNHVETLVLLER